MRIRINSLPTDGEFDEFDLRRFRVGEVYDVRTQLASLLIIAGYAQMVSNPSMRAEAADYSRVRRSKPKRRP
jgi:hypothetical protein